MKSSLSNRTGTFERRLEMFYTEKTIKAMQIAYKAHHCQLDKSGVPYIFHPIHLAEQMETEEEVIVALLHDVVEDTRVTIENLATEFSDNIIQAIKLLTHDDSMPYMDYIRKIKSNPLAKKVKLADLEHNSDTTRMPTISEIDIKRWEKYREAKEILLS